MCVVAAVPVDAKVVCTVVRFDAVVLRPGNVVVVDIERYGLLFEVPGRRPQFAGAIPSLNRVIEFRQTTFPRPYAFTPCGWAM
jgi:hypothetical protein